MTDRKNVVPIFFKGVPLHTKSIYVVINSNKTSTKKHSALRKERHMKV